MISTAIEATTTARVVERPTPTVPPAVARPTWQPIMPITQPNTKVLATPDTPFNTFSASKAVTAMVIHLLDEQRLLHIDDPVSEYIPEFGRHGKRSITIRHVLTHRAGIPNLPPDAMRLEMLDRPGEIVQLLCESRPTWHPGRRLAYHAISGGFLLGEIVKRVTGDDIRWNVRFKAYRPASARTSREPRAAQRSRDASIATSFAAASR